MPTFKYEYDDAREYAHSLGIAFLESWLPVADMEFAQAGLTQDQVDQMMRSYIWRVYWLFNPANYTISQRIKMALHFLFSKGRRS